MDRLPRYSRIATCLFGASVVWSAAAQAGGAPGALDGGGALLPRAGAPGPMIIEGQAATELAGENVVVVVSSEGTLVYSRSDYRALEDAGGTPIAAQPTAARPEPPATITVQAAPPSAIGVSQAPAMPVSPPEPIASSVPTLEPPMQTAARGPDNAGLGGFLSEVRLGAMAHDVGVFGRSKEEGPDVNAELLFVSPEFLGVAFSPRPHLGVTVNTRGDTSQVYAGLTWDWTFWAPFFVEASLGVAVHDGEIDVESQDKKAFGCRALFRESVSLGARFFEQHSISMMLAHISNASLCDSNEGLDTVGVRYGYRF